ncbi:MAG: phosphoribosylformylglycinamidine synthase subunit PurL [Candidatus Peribacteraceae bacterium]|nr:phosphoribosylformylglycinamidine synthase subunit PurL [Candidatus Peribacteraceae bacterium]MDD5742466.1 phosphoribosylformylglycinamidine synthase subunit PurL [Candidatus Peribacteraceae bacterium]
MTSSDPLPTIPLLPLSSKSDADVKELLKKHKIGLTVEEARKITTLLGRDPTIVEATIWGIQGSEHCSYKSSRRFLKTFPTESSHVILGPKEDSGIVAVTDAPAGKRWGLVISHESHNHPSQIVPFEGAATGIGGVVRDVVCMGARVIGALDALRLGDLKTEESRTIAREVARGIAGYGNPLGIPNLGGDTVFDASYNSNCLVNAIAVGIVREDEVIHSEVPPEAGEEHYDIILVGKPTDHSGFGGASFASASMEEEKKEQNAGAVQEPNPFLERHILASTYALFDWLAANKHLDKVSFKDLGAGGVVCASVEQVADRGLGAEVDLTAVHTAVNDLPPEVIGCAETQERFCWICHPSLTDHILRHYNDIWDLPAVAENARASRIGTVTTDPLFRLTYRGQVVCAARALDITCGLQYKRPTTTVPVTRPEPAITCTGNRVSVSGRTFTLAEIFEAMLRHPNAASVAPLIRHYDKDVIGISVIEAGEADAGVIMPLSDLSSYVHEGSHPGWEDLPDRDKNVGVALAADGNGRYGRISAYWQGANAAVESMCNVAAVGAVPRAFTDCLNYGNPEIPEQLSALEEGVKGIADAARGVAMNGEPVPIVSGNVSLYNGKPDGGAIDPTAIVCCIGVLPDARTAVTMQLKKPDSVLLFVGERRDECGGSLYVDVLEQLTASPRDTLLGSQVPKPDFSAVSKQIRLITKIIQSGSAHSCHDISEGGLLLALFEMTLPQRHRGGSTGVTVDIASFHSSLRSDALLFSQTGGFLLEVPQRLAEGMIRKGTAAGVPVFALGSTTPSPRLTVMNGKETLIDVDLHRLQNIWKEALSLAWSEPVNYS